MKKRYLISSFCVGFTCAVFLTRLTSCQLIPNESMKQQSIRAQETVASKNSIEAASNYRVAPPSETLKVKQPDQISIVGGRTNMVEGASIEITRPAASEASTQIKTGSNQSAGASQDLFGSSSVSIPLGVKIALIGVGIILVVFAIKYALKSAKGTAFGAAISAADAYFAQIIAHVQSKAATTTDPVVLTQMNDLKGLAENLRGKLSNPNVTSL